MKKNFKTMRKNGYYRRGDGIIVQVEGQAVNGDWIVGEDYYTSEGLYLRLNYRRLNYHSSHVKDLIEEVIVTPVKPPQPRECWALFNAAGKVVFVDSSPSDVGDVGAYWVRLSEVMPGEEEGK